MYGHDGVRHPQGRAEHLTHGWGPHQAQPYQYESEQYVYSSAGTAVSNGTSNNSVEDDYEREAYQHTGHLAGPNGQEYGEHASGRNCFPVTIKCILYNVCY